MNSNCALRALACFWHPHPRFIYSSILTHCQHVQDLQQNMPRKLAAAHSKSSFLTGKECQRNVHRVDLQIRSDYICSTCDDSHWRVCAIRTLSPGLPFGMSTPVVVRCHRQQTEIRSFLTTLRTKALHTTTVSWRGATPRSVGNNSR